MLAPNVARFLEGELGGEVRGNVVAHPLAPDALRRAGFQCKGQELRSDSNPIRPEPDPVLTETKNPSAPKPRRSRARVRAEAKAFRRGFLTAAAVLIALPSALLVAVMSEGSRQTQHKENRPVAASIGVYASVLSSKNPEIVVTSPHKLEAEAGAEIEFEIAIDATEALPERSLVAISAVPEGASFSEGRPYGMTGWSLRPDEIGELRLLLPKSEGSYDIRIELLAGDGTPLAHSETRLKISKDNQQLAAGMDASEISTAAESYPPPLPQRVPSESTLTVNRVKTETIEAATPAIASHQFGAASTPPADTPAPAEWVQVVNAVNMRPRPDKTTNTIKVAPKGAKLRVLARNKGWVQVSDPKTSVKGWVYRGFVKPAEPPADGK